MRVRHRRVRGGPGRDVTSYAGVGVGRRYGNGEAPPGGHLPLREQEAIRPADARSHLSLCSSLRAQTGRTEAGTQRRVPASGAGIATGIARSHRGLACRGDLAVNGIVNAPGITVGQFL